VESSLSLWKKGENMEEAAITKPEAIIKDAEGAMAATTKRV